MNALKIGSIVNVKTCSQCQGNTEYHCQSCQQDLCSNCKEEHVIDLYTNTHHVTIYRERFYSGYKQEVCKKHPGQLLEKYCESCGVSLCNKCRMDTTHNIIDVKIAYKTKREQTMRHFLSETLYTMRILHSGLHAEVNACKRMIYCRQSEMVVKAQRLKHLIGGYSHHWFKKLRKCLSMQNIRILNYENRSEKCVIKPVQFLRFIKKTDRSTCCITRYDFLSQTQKINMKGVVACLSEIQVIGTKKRQVVNEILPSLMPATDLIKPLPIDIQSGLNISHFVLVHPDRIWVCTYNNLILADTKSGAVFQKYNFASKFEHLFETPFGTHTINLENELICIDDSFDIIKISKDGNRTIIKKSTHQGTPSCVYCCPSTGDLLVGLSRSDESMGKVTRYHNARHSTQTTGHEETDYVVSPNPYFITKNNNGDVVVSCVDPNIILNVNGALEITCTIVVLEHDGRRRFTYNGPPCGPKLRPGGICTEPLSNILVCDGNSSVQIVDKNGLFLFYLQTGIKQPFTLQFDTFSYMLWIGNREGNILYSMRYLSRQGLQQTGDYPMYALSKCVKLQDICRCLHISCVNEERAWVSDLVSVSLADTRSGKILCSLEEVWDQSFTGHFSVNREGELFYIDVSLNIAKFSFYAQSREIFLKEAKSSWKPKCLYCSLYTEELLVAIRFMDVHAKKDSAMVIRYDSTGQLKQTIQHNNIGQDLYIFPRFITENNNGDVVVSDKYNGVVVTSREGRHRFSYTGPQSGSRFDPWGICTDAHSHILVCDGNTSAVQIIDSDGQFLSFLPIKHLELDIKPFSLNYDVSNLLLYVGSIDGHTIHVFRDITQYTALTEYYEAYVSDSE